MEFIDQNPIGKSSRSNPATYLKAYDEIRQLSAIHDFKNLRFEALSVAALAGHGYVGHELHFYCDHTLTLAFLTPSALGVEREICRITI